MLNNMSGKYVMKLKGLYAITDEKWTPARVMPDAVESALAGGASVVQLRDKTSPLEELLPLADRVAELCHARGAIFIVNDRVDLAERCHCDGVHLGRDDCDFREARKRLGNRIIGVSCYNDLERALEFQDAGADYVAFGSFFPSPTKPDAAKADIELLARAKDVLHVPVCAIGGISLDNVGMLIAGGADMVAVISALWGCGSIMERAAAFSEKFRTPQLVIQGI
jgi:thiamine-phosphate pyrophosphorylase